MQDEGSLNATFSWGSEAVGFGVTKKRGSAFTFKDLHKLNRVTKEPFTVKVFLSTEVKDPPRKKHHGVVGYDVASLEDGQIPPLSAKKIPTGLYVVASSFSRIEVRGIVPSQNVFTATTAIHHGELFVSIYNGSSTEPWGYSVGQIIAQLVPERRNKFTMVGNFSENLLEDPTAAGTFASSTERGGSAFNCREFRKLDSVFPEYNNDIDFFFSPRVKVLPDQYGLEYTVSALDTGYISPKTSKWITTGVYVAPPKNTYIEVCDDPTVFEAGCVVVGGIRKFRGEIFVILYNGSNTSWHYLAGRRIARLVPRKLNVEVYPRHSEMDDTPTDVVFSPSTKTRSAFTYEQLQGFYCEPVIVDEFKFIMSPRVKKDPSQDTTEDVGYDVAALEDGEIPPTTTKTIPTGVFVVPPFNYYAQVTDNPILAKYGLMTVGGVSNYSGEIFVNLYNGTTTTWKYSAGDTIAKVVARNIVDNGISFSYYDQ